MALDRSLSFHTYRDYVADLQEAYPEYSWLGNFLAASGASPSETCVSVIDGDDDGGLRRQDCSGSVPALVDVLRHRPASARTRIVHVKYRQSWSVDRDVVNAVGMHFWIDPAFFWGHFAHYWNTREALCPATARRTQSHWVEPLPSDMFSLEVGVDSLAFSALLVCEGMDKDKSANTAIIFSRDGQHELSSSHARYSERALRPADFDGLPQHLRRLSSTWSEAVLLKMQPKAVKSAHEHPARFIYPFARLFAAEMNIWVQNYVELLEKEFASGAAALAAATVLEVCWTGLHDMEANLRSTLKSISRFPAMGPPGRAELLAEDFRDVLARAEKAQEDLRDYLNRHVGMMSLRESRLAVEASERSILQAQSVNRLTKLALVFVPLSFVTSFFGMNFKEFGEGSLSLWVFAVAAASLAFALVLFFAFVGFRRAQESDAARPANSAFGRHGRLSVFSRLSRARRSRT